MQKTILIIEDNQDMADNIGSILELAHYKVLIAHDGKTGVALAQQQLPDLILCDIMMPELDGYGVLQILNGEPQTARIPFIFLTARADKADQREGMMLGADDYITKPFDACDLLKVIEIRLKKNTLLRTDQKNEGHDLLASFDKAREMKEFQKLSQDRPVRVVRKKEFLFWEGQTANELYLVKKGKLKTSKLNPDGKELITGIYGPGDFMGYVPLLEDKPHHENAEALEASEIVLIPRQDFLMLYYSSKDMAHKFTQLLTHHLAESEDRLLRLAYQSVRQRVAWALLRIAGHFNSPDGKTVVSVARRDLSNLIGTATESLNRTLADFKDEGLVEIDGEGIRIVDKSKLEKLSR